MRGAKTRKPVEVPSSVREAIDAITKESGSSLLATLQAFAWKSEYQSKLERGDFSHWLDLFNFFDDWLDKHVKSRPGDLSLDFEQAAAKQGDDEDAKPKADDYPPETSLEILRVSRVVLENCANRHTHLLGSLDHLAKLLASPSPEVVFSTLQTLVTLSRRSVFQSIARWHHGSAELSDRLYSMAQGWAGGTDMPSLQACARGLPAEPAPGDADSTCGLHFQFFRDQPLSTSAGNGARGHHVIHMASLSGKGETSHELCKQLVSDHGVPKKLRFALLCRIRVARGLETAQGRRECAKRRLLALRILLQSTPDHSELGSLLLNEPGLIRSLLDVLYCQGEGTSEFKVLAAKALAAMCCDRNRQSAFLKFLAPVEQREKAVSFVEAAIRGASAGGEESNTLLLAVLSLVSVLSVSTAGCTLLTSLGMVQVLTQVISAPPKLHLQAVSCTVRILEALVGHDSRVLGVFRAAGGLPAMVGRLKSELASVDEGAGTSSSAGDATSTSPVGATLEKRLLVKSLLRGIAVTCYSQVEWNDAGAARALSTETDALAECLGSIFKKARALGSSIFAIAATVMADLLHHDPLCFPAIQKHGLPSEFIQATKGAVQLTPDAICCLPNTLVALCLNKAGLQVVMESDVLSGLAEVFVSHENARALAGDTPSVLGSGLEQLLRHVPEMKDSCIGVLLDILKRLVAHGGEVVQKGAGGGQGEAGGSGGDKAEGGDSVKPMETDEQRVEEKAGDAARQASLTYMREYINNYSRLLEGMLSNRAVSAAFVDAGGIKLLLKLYTFGLRPSLSSGTVGHLLFSAFRVLSGPYPAKIAEAINEELNRLLEEWFALDDMVSVASSMIIESWRSHLEKEGDAKSEELKNLEALGKKQGSTEKALDRVLCGLEGLVSLGSNLLRSSSPMLNGLSAEESSRLLQSLGKLQSSLMWHLSLSLESKQLMESEAAAKGASDASKPEKKEPPKEQEEAQEASTSRVTSTSTSTRPSGPAVQSTEEPPKYNSGQGASKAWKGQESLFDLGQKVMQHTSHMLQAIIRNISNGRRRNEPPEPSKEAFSAAASLTGVAHHYLQHTEAIQEWAPLKDLPLGKGNGSEDKLRRLLRVSRRGYAARAANEIFHLLEDQRRRACNHLLVNAFVRGGIFSRALEQFTELSKQLASVLDEKKKVAKDHRRASFEDASFREDEDRFRSWLETKLERSVELKRLLYEQRNLEEVLGNFLNLFIYLINPSQMLSTVYGRATLVVKFPEGALASVLGEKFKEQDVPSDSYAFVSSMQKQALRVLAEFWRLFKTRSLPEELVAEMVSFFCLITDGVKRPDEKKPEEKTFKPDEAVIEQILGMGFTRGQAVCAITKVRSNNLELAMEWILTHPESTSAQDDDVQAALAMSLNATKEGEEGQGEASTSSPEEAAEDLMPSVTDLLGVFFNSMGEDEENPVMIDNCFELTRLLEGVCTEERGTENMNEAVEYLVSRFQSAEPVTKFAAVHVFLLLACKNKAMRFYHFGQTLEACTNLLKSVDQATSSDKAEEGSKPTEGDLSEDKLARRSKIHRWLSPVLLLLDCYMKLFSRMEFDEGFGSTAKEELQANTENLAMVKQISGGKFQMEVARKAQNILSYLCKSKDSESLSALVGQECVHALLQVMATASKNHSVALDLHQRGVLSLLLRLPVAYDSSSSEHLTFLILRCIVEDPFILQNAMEVQIRSTVQGVKPKSDRQVELSAVTKQLIPLLVRSKKVFVAALVSTCEIRTDGGKTLLALKQQQVKEFREPKRRRSSAGARHLKNADKSPSKGSTDCYQAVLNCLMDVVTHNREYLSDMPTHLKDEEATAWQTKQKTYMKNVSLALAVLTDFCIHYAPCIHCVLKVDSLLSFHRMIIDQFLPLHSGSGAKTGQKELMAAIADRSLCFLIAACIRSSEARSRIITYITRTLSGAPPYGSSKAADGLGAKKLRALVEFVNSLLSASTAKLNRSFDVQEHTWSLEIVRDMKDMKVIQALVCAINSIELDHPEAPRSLNAVLRPLNTILEAVNKYSASLPGAGGAGAESSKRAEKRQGDAATARPAADAEAGPQAMAQMEILRDAAEAGAMEAAMEEIGAQASPPSLAYRPGMVGSRRQALTSDSEDSYMSEDYTSSANSLDPSDSEDEHSVLDDDEGDSDDAIQDVSDIDEDGAGGDEDSDPDICDDSDIDRSDEDAGEDGGWRESYHQMPIRVTEVGSDMNSQSSDETESRRHAMMDEDDDNSYQLTGDQSDEWSDSPVIEVRVRSPFQQNNGTNTAPDPASLHTGFLSSFPLLEDFFGVLGVRSDRAPVSGYRIRQSRPQGSLGAHPLLNPDSGEAEAAGWQLTEPSHNVIDYHLDRSHLQRVFAPGGTLLGTSGTTQLIWDQHPSTQIRMQQRLSNLADGFGGNSSFNIWSTDQLNDGFGAFSSAPGRSSAAALVSRALERLPGDPARSPMATMARAMEAHALPSADRSGRSGSAGAGGSGLGARDAPNQASLDQCVEAAILAAVPKAAVAKDSAKKAGEGKGTPKKGAGTPKKAQQPSQDEPPSEGKGKEGKEEAPAAAAEGDAGSTGAAAAPATAEPAPAQTDAVPAAPPGEPASEPASEPAEGAGGDPPTPAAPAAPAAPEPDSHGIDPAFLEALPPELREEVLSSRGAAAAAARPQPPTEAPPAGQPAEGAPPAAAGDDGAAADLDPEFLAALPPDIQAEVLAQQRQQQQQQQASQAAPGPGGAADMDIANVLATFPPDIREEVLLTLDDAMVAALPPAVMAEAQSLRDRAVGPRPFPLAGEGPVPTYSAALTRRGPGGRSLLGPGLAAGGREGGNAASARRISQLSSRRSRVSGEPALVDAEGVRSILKLLRVARPLGKGLMHRLMLNLCVHSESCRQALRSISEVFQCAIAAGEAEGEEEQAGSPEATAEGRAGKDPFHLFGCEGDMFYASRSGQGVPHVVIQRSLSLLTYLTKYDKHVSLLVASFTHPRTSGAGGAQAKGKATMEVDGAAGTAQGGTTVLEELFRLVSGSAGENPALFEQLLQLLETVLGDVAAKVALAAEASKIKDKAPGPSEVAGTAAGAAGGGAGEGGAGGAEQPGKSPLQGTPRWAEDKKAASACVRAIQSFLPAHLSHLPRLLNLHAGSSTSCSHLRCIMTYVCKAVPEARDDLVTHLSAQAACCVAKCTSQLEQEMSDAGGPRRYGKVTSATNLLRIVQSIRGLCALPRTPGVVQAGPGEAAQEQHTWRGFQGLRSESAGLWAALGRYGKLVQAEVESEEGGGFFASPEHLAQILPLVEAFAVLCAKPAGEAKEGEEAKAARGAAGEDEGGTAFLKFAEEHSPLVNRLIKQNPSSLSKSFRVLLDHPRLIEFENKCSYFRTKVTKSREDGHFGSLRVCVRRDYVFEDSFHQLRHRTPHEMHSRLSIQFQGEEGVDAGGLTREWYQVMARAVFKEELALFTSSGSGTTFQPNPNSMIQNEGVDHLQYFRLVGRFVGKALIDGQVVDAYFTRSMYKHMLGQPLSYEDIEAVDPDYFKNLKWMLENDIEGVLDLNFTAETDYFGKKGVVDLKEGGSKVPVTNENKAEYVNLIAKHRMTSAIEPQIKAFMEGFWELVPKDLLVIFNDNELELLISGLPEFEVKDLRENAEYTGYHPTSPVILWFWEVVQAMSKEDKARLLQFCTGTSKVPLEGFKALQGISGPQKFQIHKSYGSSSLLPTAHTCFNQLDLVEYESKEELKERLMLAIHEGGEGFGFV